MNEIDVFQRMGEVAGIQQVSFASPEEAARIRRIAAHKLWLNSIRHERPSTAQHYRIGIYIRFFNQTKYENYLDYHKKQFLDCIALCPNWELVDFYVDEGSTPPNMESAPAWCQLLDDCMDGKVDLIITQKVSNVSKKMPELTVCARILAAQSHPIGIYFISEDLFTLASYYQDDLHDTEFLPDHYMEELPENWARIEG